MVDRSFIFSYSRMRTVSFDLEGTQSNCSFVVFLGDTNHFCAPLRNEFLRELAHAARAPIRNK